MWYFFFLIFFCFYCCPCLHAVVHWLVTCVYDGAVWLHKVLSWSWCTCSLVCSRGVQTGRQSRRKPSCWSAHHHLRSASSPAGWGYLCAATASFIGSCLFLLDFSSCLLLKCTFYNVPQLKKNNNTVSPSCFFSSKAHSRSLLLCCSLKETFKDSAAVELRFCCSQTLEVS